MIALHLTNFRKKEKQAKGPFCKKFGEGDTRPAPNTRSNPPRRDPRPNTRSIYQPDGLTDCMSDRPNHRRIADLHLLEKELNPPARTRERLFWWILTKSQGYIQ